MAFSFRDYRASARASAPARPAGSQLYDSAESVGPFRDPYTSANYGQKRKRRKTKRGQMAKGRRRGRRGGKKVQARRRRRNAAFSTQKRRGGRRRNPVMKTRRRRRGGVARIARRGRVSFRRRRSGRRGNSSRGMSLKTMQQDIFNGLINGGWVVAGDVAGNLAKIFSGQTGALGNVAQLAGGFLAGMFVNKVWPKQRDATRFVMAGAASGIIRQIAADLVNKMDGTSAIKTKLSAALQGYPHSDYEAMATLQGYTNSMSESGYVGMPGYNGQ